MQCLFWRYDGTGRSALCQINADTCYCDEEFRVWKLILYLIQDNTITAIVALKFHVMDSLAQFESVLINKREKADMARGKLFPDLNCLLTDNMKYLPCKRRCYL